MVSRHSAATKIRKSWNINYEVTKFLFGTVRSTTTTSIRLCFAGLMMLEKQETSRCTHRAVIYKLARLNIFTGSPVQSSCMRATRFWPWLGPCTARQTRSLPNWNILMQRSGFGLWKIRWSVLFEAGAHIIRVLFVGSDQQSPSSYVIAICECETNNSSDGQRPFSLRDRPSVRLGQE
jgi:hypothetical protein